MGRKVWVIMTMISMGAPQGIPRKNHSERPSIGGIAKVLRDLLRNLGVPLDDPRYATVHRAAQQLRGVTQADLTRVVIAASAPRLLAALEGLARGSEVGPEEALKRLMADLSGSVPAPPRVYFLDRCGQSEQIDPFSLPVSSPAEQKRTGIPSLEQLGLIPQPG